MMKFLTHNGGLKLFSLLLAIGLWYYALGEEGIDVTRTVPLQIEVKNEQLSLLESTTKSVKITLNAPRSLLTDMTSGEIIAKHVIGEKITTVGDYSFRLESRDFKLPSPQMRVIQVEPEVVKIKLDELVVQKMKIEPHFSGEPAFGYDVVSAEVQLDPNAIMVEGPKSQLSQVSSVKTEPLDLIGRIRSFRRTVTLDLPPHVRTMNDVLIDAYIPIREQFEEKLFEEVTVKILRGPKSKEKMKAEPSKVSFTLKGSTRQLERLLPESMLAYVDASELKVGEHDVKVELVLPEDVTLKEDSLAVKVVIE